jgi:hypothetical protein
MAEWGNGTNQRHQTDMDSNGYKLKVRNTSGTYQESAYRAEITETAESEQALHVKGLTDLERTNNDYPDQAIALTVKGKMNIGPWSVEPPTPRPRPQPILLAEGRSEFQAYADDPEHPAIKEHALKVTGRAFFTMQEIDDLMAIKSNGSIRIRLNETTQYGDNTCGVLTPVLSQLDDIQQFQLQINANPDDRPNPDIDQPHVRIGWNNGVSPSTGRGNVVAIRPKKLLLGLAPFELFYPDNYRIKMKGSTNIEPEQTGEVALRVQGKT